MSRGVPISVMALALALLAGDATAQHRTTFTWQRPNPQASRPMGVPASVQPSGQPRPAPPGCFYRCGPPGPAPVYFYPVPVLYGYPTVYARPGAHDRGAHGADGYADPQTRWAPVMTYVGTPSPSVRVRRFVPDRAAGCAVVEIRMAGERWRSPVPLPTLGAETHDALFRALAERLADGQQVPLVTLNGTRVVLAGGPGISGLNVEPCDVAPSPADESGS